MEVIDRGGEGEIGEQTGSQIEGEENLPTSRGEGMQEEGDGGKKGVVLGQVRELLC